MLCHVLKNHDTFSFQDKQKKLLTNSDTYMANHLFLIFFFEGTNTFDLELGTSEVTNEGPHSYINI